MSFNCGLINAKILDWHRLVIGTAWLLVYWIDIVWLSAMKSISIGPQKNVSVELYRYRCLYS